MLRVLRPVLTIALLLMATPASAIPVCSAGTMADYIAFGSTGCNINNLTFLSFSYSGSVRSFRPFSVSGGPDLFGSPVIPSPPPSAISVVPRSNVTNLGSGGAALAFSPEFVSAFGAYWSFFDIGFDVFARTGPGIVEDTLSAGIRSVANLQSGGIGESAVPGGGLGIVQSISLCSNHPSGVPASPFCANPTSLSIPFTRFQEIDISGFNVDSFETGFATPEPATLLLVGTGAAGLCVARWVRRRSDGHGRRAKPLSR